jgi:pentatricopeptide repeat protein
MGSGLPVLSHRVSCVVCCLAQPNFVGPDDTTYTALISAFAKCGDVGSAARYLVEMAETTYTPSLDLLVRDSVLC